MVEQLQRVRTVHDHYPKGNIKGLRMCVLNSSIPLFRNKMFMLDEMA